MFFKFKTISLNMNTDLQNNYTKSINSFINSKGRRYSTKSNLSTFSKNTKKSKTAKRKSKSSSKICEIDYSKSGIDTSKYNQIKRQLNCSFCLNPVLKSALRFSCNHFLCSNCISRQILKKGINECQSKTVQGIFIIDCPCNSGNSEIILEELLSLLYIDEDCLNHGEFKSCPKCSLWTSVLSQIKLCEIHRNQLINNNNNFEIIIKDYCLDCKKELCSLCMQESHEGHNIRSLENIINGIQKMKRKNQNFGEFYKFINLIEDNFNKDYNKEYEINISKFDEAINKLIQMKKDFEETMSKKLNYSKNIFSLIKYIYYFYYTDLITVKNNIRVIDYLSQNKYELQNVSFNPNPEFSSKLNSILFNIKNFNLESFECNINTKNDISNCFFEKQNAHDGYIFDLLNINNKYLISAGEDRKIKIWSLNPKNYFTNIELDDLKHDSSVFSLCKDNIGKKFFSGSYGEIKIWSAEDFNLINILYGHKDYVTHMEMIRKKINQYVNNVSKDFLCSCSYDKTIKIWDLDALNCVCTLEGHTDKINYFMQDDKGFIISCSSDESIKLWNVDDEKCFHSLDKAHDGPIYCLTKTEEGKIISSSYSTIKIFDLERNKVDTIFTENNKGIYKLLMLPGNKLVSSSFKYIYFWDLNKNNLLYSIEAHNNYITCLLIINDKLVSSSDDGDIKIWD